jgi:hypothetical protein
MKYLLITFLLFGKFSSGQDSLAMKSTKKYHFGIGLGIGKSVLKPGQLNLNYPPSWPDSVKSIDGKGIAKLDLSIFYQYDFSNRVSMRPAITESFEGGIIEYGRLQTTESVKVQLTTLLLSVPLVVSPGGRTKGVYLALGPALAYTLTDPKNYDYNYTLKRTDFLGEVVVGFHFLSSNGKVYFMPELRYSHGFSNLKEFNSSVYSGTLNELKRKHITFSFFIGGN